MGASDYNDTAIENLEKKDDAAKPTADDAGAPPATETTKEENSNGGK